MSWKCKICQISGASDIVRLKGLFAGEKGERKEANEEMSDNVEVNPFGDEVLQSSEGKVVALPGFFMHLFLFFFNVNFGTEEFFFFLGLLHASGLVL